MDMTTHSRLDDGDVVIREDSRDGRRVYILRRVPGPDQYLLRSRDEAVAQAARFAARRRVRVWMHRAGETAYALVGDYRPAPALTRKSPSRQPR